MARRGRDGALEAFWRGTLRRREESGLTIVEFCRREGLSSATYHFWRRELQRRDAESVRSRVQTSPTATLVPVQLVDDRGGCAPIEIVAGNGFVVRVSEGATTEHLRRVLQIMSELAEGAKPC